MNNLLLLREKIYDVLMSLNLDVKEEDVIIETSKDPLHGDYATNAALKFSKLLKMNPRQAASLIVDKINMDFIEKIEIAGPGFINFFLKNDLLYSVIDKIFDQTSHFGDQKIKNETINIEYVSANPTGDLHLGHARGAAIGDSIARILKKAGYNIIREFYVNDAGNQMMNLAKSLKSRYFSLFDKEYPLPEDGYHGKDIISIAKLLKKEQGDTYLSSDDSNILIFKEYGMEKEIDKLKRDLDEFRVHFDVFSFETAIRANNNVENLLDKMHDYTYIEEGATFLKTSSFLDDKDRVIIKNTGDYTYFLPDICYHLNKLSRDANKLIDVLGADHHGYINRMKSALMMNGYSKDVLEVELVQMVRIIKDGKEVKMSKRTGNAIKMRDLIKEVGIDSVRYFFVSRASSSHLDFDLDLALAQSSSNPVFYAQYAHARIMNILNIANIHKNKKYDLLNEEIELSIMKTLNEYGKIIKDAADNRAPYKLCNYIQKLSGLVHEYYAKCRILDVNNTDLTGARLALMNATAIVLKDALSLIGVEAPLKM